MNIYQWNTINPIFSFRTYINTSIILLPTILLSLLTSTGFRTFQSLCVRFSGGTHLAWTWLAGNTFAGLFTCSAISFPVALFISNKTIVRWCPRLVVKAFARHQLNEIWSYMVSMIIRLGVSSLVYSSSDSSRCKVRLNIDFRMYGSFGPLSLSMNLQFPSMAQICIRDLV